MILFAYFALGIIVYFLSSIDKEYKFSKHKAKCIYCKKEVEYESIYCPYCNEKLKKRCENCGRLIEINWRYCPFCRNDKK
ncbi:zinc ribbon domain-containing protein [Caloranaerobacter sp. DY30410]|uniref:zinc ribbon domain-containing protein n=1 Tax=Caloranaerobacter sp. DY30410 TaxID=3238305 RepID=UPI003D0189DB